MVVLQRSAAVIFENTVFLQNKEPERQPLIRFCLQFFSLRHTDFRLKTVQKLRIKSLRLLTKSQLGLKSIQ